MAGAYNDYAVKGMAQSDAYNQSQPGFQELTTNQATKDIRADPAYQTYLAQYKAALTPAVLSSISGQGASGTQGATDTAYGTMMAAFGAPAQSNWSGATQNQYNSLQPSPSSQATAPNPVTAPDTVYSTPPSTPAPAPAVTSTPSVPASTPVPASTAPSTAQAQNTQTAEAALPDWHVNTPVRRQQASSGMQSSALQGLQSAGRSVLY
jgi:hypothetical protein